MPLINCKLFMPADSGPNASILLLAPSVYTVSFMKGSAPTVEHLALSFKYRSELPTNFPQRNLPNQLQLHRTWQFCSKVFIFAKVNFPSQIFQGRFQCNLLRFFIIHWQLHGILAIRLDIWAKGKDA